MRKQERHDLISKIIHEQAIRNQGQLMTALKDHGVEATQATISRDIRDLQIIKTIDAAGLPKFEIFETGLNSADKQDEEEKRLKSMVKETVLKVEPVQFMTVVHTQPDNAHLLASVLDEISLDFMVATMASFDTIIIISRTIEEAQQMSDYLLGFINE
jgi:transcriptional regulator of arginine metabolism